MQDKNKKQKGIILSGPPGVGKTQITRALAGSAQITFITSHPADLLAETGKETYRNINALFLKAKNNAPCILFIDEIDSLLANKLANSCFLTELDGENELLGVTVIGATNYPDEIDHRIKRSGRMSIEIKIPLPNKSDRKEIISYYLHKNNIEAENECVFNQLIERTITFSGADIKEYISNLKSYLEDNKIQKINSKILFTVFIDMVIGAKTNKLIPQKELIQIAYHETCHALLQYILYKEEKAFSDISFFTIEPHSDFFGASFTVNDEEIKSYKKEYLESELKILLAGRVGQELFLNQIDTGSYSDLQKATDLAYSFIGKFAMGKKLTVKRPIFSNELELMQSKEIKNEVEALLQKEYTLVKKFLLSYPDLVKIIVTELLEKKLLHKQDIEIIINQYEENYKKVIL